MRCHRSLTGFLCLCGVLNAANPAWWTQTNTAIIDPNASHDIKGNYAPANLGQLKNFAKKAAIHLDHYCPGGRGTAIASLVSQFEPNLDLHTYTPEELSDLRKENYAPVNLGQLKAVAKPFYDRLLAAGVDTKASIVSHGVLGWSYDYPWNPSTPKEENYAPANIGQLKLVFSFDLSINANLDSDGDGLSNLQEHLAGTNPLDPNDPDLGGSDEDSDGATAAQEALVGTNPAWKDHPAVQLVTKAVSLP